MACTEQKSEEIARLVAGSAGAARGSSAAQWIDDLLRHIEDCPDCSAELDAAAALATALGDEEERQLARPFRETGAYLRLLWPLAAALLLFLGLRLLAPPQAPGPRGADLARLTPLPYVPSQLRAAPGPPPPPEFETGMQLYTAGDYPAAARALEAAVAAGDRRSLTQLYLGLSALFADDWARARPALLRAAEAPEGLISERALWYLAGGHLRAGEWEAARSRLCALRDGRGTYSLEAAELLAEMDGR